MEKVLILSGSKSDNGIVEKATKVFEAFGIDYKYEVASAHRNQEKVDELVSQTSAKVIIAVAGLSAALPGVVAARTIKPVIGVPVNAALGGLDSLLSVVQMPPNIPVASVGIDNAKNAALLAIEILALNDHELKVKLQEFREKLKE